MPTVIERSSAEFAGRVIDSLLPGDEEVRRACLTALADSINMAHAHGEAMWGITLHSNIVRLNVGHVVPFDIRRDGIFVAVIEDALAGLTRQERAALDELVEWQGQFHSIKGSQSFHVAPENFPLVWPLIQQPQAAFIERAVQGVTQLHRDSREAYSPGVAAFLRQALSREIPEPHYEAAGSKRNWHDELTSWLKHNPKVMPDELR